MILNDLFESGMSRVLDTMREIKTLSDDEFIRAHDMSKHMWVRTNWPVIKSVASDDSEIKKHLQKPVGDEHLFRGTAVPRTVHEADKMTKSGRARQQASLYNTDGETYRGHLMPDVSDKDITQKSQQVPRVSHQDLVTQQDDLNDPIEKTELDIDRKKLQQLIKRQIKTLKPIEQEVLIDRYWHELPLSKIGQRLKLSVERIRQIEAKALRKLRHPSRSADTKPFVDPSYVKPKPPTPLKSIVNPELAYKTGYNDAMSGQLHRFNTAYLSNLGNEPYNAGYEAGKRKQQTANLDRVSDIAEGSQTFGKHDPYWVCLNGKKWKRFDTYEHARAVHDRLEKKLRSEGSDKKVSLLADNGVQEGLRDPKDNPCWKGYKPVGTKQKGGRTVPNCVPKE